MSAAVPTQPAAAPAPGRFPRSGTTPATRRSSCCGSLPVAPIASPHFFNVLVDWPQYSRRGSRHLRAPVMYLVGIVEILAGVAVALRPRYGAPLVAAWLAGIIFNLLTYSGWYDVALRDFGLLLAALTLTRLAFRYDPPRRRRDTSA